MNTGEAAGSLVYNADLPVISRLFRHLREIHPVIASLSLFGMVLSSTSSPACWGHADFQPKH